MRERNEGLFHLVKSVFFMWWQVGLFCRKGEWGLYSGERKSWLKMKQNELCVRACVRVVQSERKLLIQEIIGRWKF